MTFTIGPDATLFIALLPFLCLLLWLFWKILFEEEPVPEGFCPHCRNLLIEIEREGHWVKAPCPCPGALKERGDPPWSSYLTGSSSVPVE